jgi:peptide/nickel transport system substrate-binding protein
MTNQKMRQAIEVALDMQPIMQAACGDPHLYALDASIYPKGSPWYTTAGGSWYNAHNVDQAKALAKEAGYAGQPIRWLATQEYDFMFKSSVVAASQLQQAGFAVDLQVVEWATLLQRRTNPADWDIFVTSTGAQPDPGLTLIFSSTYPGWWDTPEKNAAFARFNAEPDFAKRRQQWAQLQTMLYQEVPMVRVGNLALLELARRNLPGFKASHFAIIPWNVQAVK